MQYRMRRRALALAVAGTLVAALAGCAAAEREAAGEGDELAGELTIYAAASLGAAFDTLAERFEQRHPGVDVRPVVYDGSSALATQIIEGAPADVFAAADESTMTRVQGEGLARSPELFASNTLVIAVPDGEPGRVTSLADLADPGLTVVLCAPDVPCGAASAALLAAEGVQVTPASLEQNVTAVLTKVAVGEADAGLVYATDVARRPGVRAVDAAGADEVVNRYPIAALTGAANPAAAAAFVAFVTGDEGRAVLDDVGFGAP